MDEAFLGEKRMHRDRAVILDGSGFFFGMGIILASFQTFSYRRLNSLRYDRKNFIKDDHTTAARRSFELFVYFFIFFHIKLLNSFILNLILRKRNTLMIRVPLSNFIFVSSL